MRGQEALQYYLFLLVNKWKRERTPRLRQAVPTSKNQKGLEFFVRSDWNRVLPPTVLLYVTEQRSSDLEYSLSLDKTFNVRTISEKGDTDDHRISHLQTRRPTK